MFNKIFNKFIALLSIGIIIYLTIIFALISPKISDFFYQTEFKSIQTDIERLNNIIESKTAFLKHFEDGHHKDADINSEKMLFIRQLKELIAQMKVLSSGYFFIVKDNEIIVNHNKLPSSLINNKKLNQILGNHADKAEYYTYTDNKEEYYVFASYHQYFDWYVGLNIQKNDLYIKANYLNGMLHKMTIIVLLMILIAGVILSKRLLRPIKELSNNALKVKSGDFSIRNKVNSEDELGLLAQHFNYMLDEIENNINNLESKVEERTLALKGQLYKDDVTHLKNRYAFNEKIKDNDARTLVLVDINSFNDINELYGYKVGNEVLCKFALFLEIIAQENDAIVYKIYGNVFAIVFNDSMFIFDKFEQFVNMLLEKTKREPFLIETLGINIFIDITIGIAICQTECLKKANIALQKAKKKHTTYIVYNSEIDRKQIIEDTIFWRNKIEDALINDKITPFSQAIVNQNQEIIKYEMLMRMEDIDENGNAVYISPFKFLDISVKTKQYLTLSTVMIDKSLDMLKYTDKLLSINVSFLDIDDLNFIHFLDDKLAKINEQDCKRIVFEILESDNITNYEIFEEFIEKYRKKGIQIAIDDFGTGYSNFSHIMKIRPDYLKIDASLIRNIDHDKDSYELVKSIVAFSKELNMKTIAEFVHSEEVFDLALELGIDEFQGYYFNKPEKEFQS